MDVSGHIHGPPALPSGKMPTLPTG